MSPRSIVSHSRAVIMRQQIVRKDALGALLIATHREGDTLMQERTVGILLPVAQLGRRQLQQSAAQRLVGLRATPERSNISS